jgi:hypothetical protein
MVQTTLLGLLGEAEAIVGHGPPSLRLVRWRLRQGRPEDAAAHRMLEAMLGPINRRRPPPADPPRNA